MALVRELSPRRAVEPRAAGARLWKADLTRHGDRGYDIERRQRARMSRHRYAAMLSLRLLTCGEIVSQRWPTSPHCGPTPGSIANPAALVRDRRRSRMRSRPRTGPGRSGPREDRAVVAAQPTAHGPRLADQRLPCCRPALRTRSPGTSQTRTHRTGPPPSDARRTGPPQCPCATAVAWLNTRHLPLVPRRWTSTTPAVSPASVPEQGSASPGGHYAAEGSKALTRHSTPWRLGSAPS